MTKTMKRIQGLDSIRFSCAVVVLLGHFGLVGQDVHGYAPTGISHLLLQIAAVLFNGPAAVIVFFVISGFCIHFPFTIEKSLHIPSYYIRRLLRIGLPAIAAGVLWTMMGQRPKNWNDTVCWSIFCEIIYYLLYPYLLIARKHMGWRPLIIGSYLFATVLTLANIDQLHTAANGYVALGIWTWVIGLPCWLLGCYLAEEYGRFPKISTTNIWIVRTVFVFISICLRILKFHSTALLSSNCISLNAFAFVIFFWLGLEVMYFSEAQAFQLTEWAGRWSYSLYLMHTATPMFLIYTHLDNFKLVNYNKNCFVILFSFINSYIFYLFAEYPSHKLAIIAGRRMKSKAVSLSIKT